MARFLIVEARFYDHLNDMLIKGASDALAKAGHIVDKLTVPGALEVPGAIAAAAESGQYDAFVALGVVIRGEGRQTQSAGRPWIKRSASGTSARFCSGRSTCCP